MRETQRSEVSKPPKCGFILFSSKISPFHCMQLKFYGIQVFYLLEKGFSLSCFQFDTHHSSRSLLLLCFPRHHLNMWKSHVSFPSGVSSFVVVPLYQAVRSRIAEILRALFDNTGCLSYLSLKQTVELRHLLGTIYGTGVRQSKRREFILHKYQPEIWWKITAFLINLLLEVLD